MKPFPLPTGREYRAGIVAVLGSLLVLGPVVAQPVIVSTVPVNGATGVSPSAAVVITFSEAMNTSVTTPYFVDSTTFGILPAPWSWSAGNTVLTCTPSPAFPSSRQIYWTVNGGQNPAGVPLAGSVGGTFTTAGTQLALTNAAWSASGFSFNVTSPAGQTLTVEYTGNLRSNQWLALLTTNSPAGQLHIVDPRSLTNRSLFYRARTGA
jgi:hypothetical protein